MSFVQLLAFVLMRFCLSAINFLLSHDCVGLAESICAKANELCNRHARSGPELVLLPSQFPRPSLVFVGASLFASMPVCCYYFTRYETFTLYFVRLIVRDI